MSTPNEGFQPPPPPARAPRPTTLRPFGIAFFAIGLIIAAAGIPKVNLIPGGIGTGGLLALCGIIVFVFSFIPLPVITDSEGPLPFFSKLTGIFFEPSKVFRNLRAHPHWVG